MCHTYILYTRTEHYARPSPPHPVRGYSATVISPSRSTAAAAATIIAPGITYNGFLSRCLPLPLPHLHRSSRLDPRLLAPSFTRWIYYYNCTTQCSIKISANFSINLNIAMNLLYALLHRCIYEKRQTKHIIIPDIRYSELRRIVSYFLVFC